MNIVLLLARVLLALIFIFSGLAKLIDPAGSRKAMRDFGVPAWLAPPFAILLPLAELVLAGMLIFPVSAWWGALVALALLILFTGAVAYQLARGRTPGCNCFGQVSSKPIGGDTLVRNFIFLALAGLIVGFGRLYPENGVLDWWGQSQVPQRVEVIAGTFIIGMLILETWIVFRVLRQHGELLLRLGDLEARLVQNETQRMPAAPASTVGLPIGSMAPAFSLPGLYGEIITLDFLRAPNLPVLLIFSDPGCGPCNELLPEVSRWQRDYAGKLTLVLVSRGTLEANRTKASEHKITHILLQQDREVANDYQAQGTPCALLVRPDGTIASALACGAEAIRGLTAQAVGLPVLKSPPRLVANENNRVLPVAALNGGGSAVAPSQPAKAQIGEPAPAFTLPDLDGKTFSLSDFQGKKTLLLFWNPGCGFCQRMLADLRAWEAEPPQGAPEVLVVSTGSVEENRELDLRSPVLVEAGFTIGPKFGIHGTPMAVLIDDQGKIASDVAAGAVEVFALANVGQKEAETMPTEHT